MALRWLAWWVALAVVTALLFALEENVELASIGQRLPGIGILLSDQYPYAMGIITLVALAVSFVAALFGWKLEALIARLGAQCAPTRRRTSRSQRSATHWTGDPPQFSVVASQDAPRQSWPSSSPPRGPHAAERITV